MTYLRRLKAALTLLNRSVGEMKGARDLAPFDFSLEEAIRNGERSALFLKEAVEIAEYEQETA